MKIRHILAFPELVFTIRYFLKNFGIMAAYIAFWLKILKDDKPAIFTAASHAQRTADFLT